VARNQLRDPKGLDAALMRPSSYAFYQSGDLALQAGVLAHGIAEGQYFVDGNKRTALAAMHTFLVTNGFEIQASQPQRAQWILDLATPGSTSEEKISNLADKIRVSLIPHPDQVD
jgi:death-on-curing protein